MGAERRTGLRIDTKIEVMFRDLGDFAYTYMLNVSNGGLFLKTDSPLPLETGIEMRLKLPDDQEVMEIQGRVVWSNPITNILPAGMGIQFIHMLPEHQQKIQRFVGVHHGEIKRRAML
jgi:type IV pilus assembly protein PilZ